VQWTIFSTPVSISARQLRHFTDLSNKSRSKKVDLIDHEFDQMAYLASSAAAGAAFVDESQRQEVKKYFLNQF
jgi:hypothetical protein